MKNRQISSTHSYHTLADLPETQNQENAPKSTTYHAKIR